MAAEFEKVEQEAVDRVTLELYQREGQGFGTVYGPVGRAGNIAERPVFGIDTVATAYEAFAHAKYMAEGFDCPVAVIDPNGLWNSEWGELKTR